MSRDSNGTYTLPAPYNPVTTLTKITSAWANTTLTDLATEVTNSLDRNGRGAMLARLKLINGNVAITAMGVGNPDNGFYWPSPATLNHIVSGALSFSSTVNDFLVPNAAGEGLTSAGPRTKPGRGFAANYTVVAADVSRMLQHVPGDSARTVTINNASINTDGAQFTLFNPLTSGIVTLAITGGTLTRLSTGATGSRSIAPGGYVLLERINGNWYIVTEFGVT